LGLWIKRYEFLKFGLNSDLKTSLKILFEFQLSQELPHGAFLFADTVSCR
jgi:hypothetical protein